MELILQRYSDDGTSTHGLLSMLIDRKPPLLPRYSFQCYTLEDTYRAEKIKGRTRIPAGRYELTLYKSPRFDDQYRKMFPGSHHGMLLLNNVPGFEGVLIHLGNDAADTAGCLLVGLRAETGMVTQSKLAYERIYPPIATELTAGRNVWIQIRDEIGRFPA